MRGLFVVFLISNNFRPPGTLQCRDVSLLAHPSNTETLKKRNENKFCYFHSLELWLLFCEWFFHSLELFLCSQDLSFRPLEVPKRITIFSSFKIIFRCLNIICLSLGILPLFPEIIIRFLANSFFQNDSFLRNNNSILRNNWSPRHINSFPWNNTTFPFLIRSLNFVPLK